MSEMVERVEKAILEASEHYCHVLDDALAGLFASAVLEAMRVSTAPMTEALEGCVCEWQPGFDANTAWSQAIAAALK